MISTTDQMRARANAQRREACRRAMLKTFVRAALLFSIVPIGLTVVYGFEAPNAIGDYLSQIHSGFDLVGFPYRLLPQSAGLSQYGALLLDRIEFVRFYLNSIGYALAIAAGQVVIGAMAAYALTCFRFRISNWIFGLYILLMILPFQVTMVPNFIMLSRLRLIDTAYALTLPGLFAPFSVFLFRQYMTTLPSALIEAGTIDGAHSGHIFGLIILPICKPAVCACAMLGLSESWNMLEQPLVLLKSARLYPLSLALVDGGYVDASVQFAAATLYMLPMLLFFLYFQQDIVTGIQIADLK